MSMMKPQVNPIVPVAALVVATLAAGATMWHGLFVATAGAAASTTARGTLAAPKADAPMPARGASPDQRHHDAAGRDDAARQPTNVAAPTPR